MAPMMTYKHFGWPVSPYSAKTRAYLRFKRLPFADIEPTALKLFGVIRRAVGRPVMPTVQRSDGTWLQDTSDIIDTLERAHPTPSITPTGPRQAIASLLLELHADEWLPIVAMHTRWTLPENRRFIADEFGRYSFPRLPLALSRKLAAPVADKMSSYLPILGATDETAPGIDAFVRGLIAHLDTHLSEHPFLLGERPCLGDFALYGPLWAHCHRDPGSKHLFNEAPALVDWFGRLIEPSAEPGDFLEGDLVPETLDPIFETLFAEQWPHIVALVERIGAWCRDNPDATRVPRSLGTCSFTIGGHTGQRRLLTFTQWMAQRPLSAYQALDEPGRASVDAWLARFGAEGRLAQPIDHPFERHDFKMRLVKHR